LESGRFHLALFSRLSVLVSFSGQYKTVWQTGPTINLGRNMGGSNDNGQSVGNWAATDVKCRSPVVDSLAIATRPGQDNWYANCLAGLRVTNPAKSSGQRSW